MLLTCCTDRFSRLHDVETGSPSTTNPPIPTPGELRFACQVSPSTFAGGCRDRNVYVCSTTTARIERVLQGHQARVLGVKKVLSSSYQHRSLLASIGYDDTILLWNLSPSSSNSPIGPISRLEGHAGAGWALDYSRSHLPHLLLSSSWDQTCRVWDLPTEECVLTLRGHSDNVLGICRSTSRHVFYSGSDDCCVLGYDMRSWKQVQKIGPVDFYVQNVKVLPFSDNSLVMTGSDGNIMISDIRAIEAGPLAKWAGHDDEEDVFGLEVLASQEMFVTSSFDGHLKGWKSNGRECVWDWEAPGRLWGVCKFGDEEMMIEEEEGIRRRGGAVGGEGSGEREEEASSSTASKLWLIVVVLILLAAGACFAALNLL